MVTLYVALGYPPPRRLTLLFPCGPGILLKRHSLFITHPICTNIAALLCTSAFLKDSETPHCALARIFHCLFCFHGPTSRSSQDLSRSCRLGISSPFLFWSVSYYLEYITFALRSSSLGGGLIVLTSGRYSSPFRGNQGQTLCQSRH